MSTPTQAQVRPLCFDSDKQYNEWHALARRTNLFSRHAHCTDCTPAYKARMMQQQRCSQPDVEFTVLNGELIGRLYVKEKVA